MDLYTKAVLTVIALALSVIALRNAGVVPALAQTPNKEPTKVIICDGKFGGCGMGTADDPLVVKVLEKAR